MSAIALTPHDSVLLLLDRAKKGGVGELNRTKIVKLLYFLDWRAANEIEQPITTIDWEWDKYGPFSKEIYSALSDLTATGVLAHTTAPTDYGSTEHMYSVNESTSSIDNTQVIEAVDSTLRKYGAHTAVELRNASYRTEPMLRLQRDGDRGDPVDLFAGSAAEEAAVRYLSENRPPEEFDVDIAISLYAKATG